MHQLLEDMEFNRDEIYAYLSRPFNFAKQRRMVLAFENTDADEMAAEFIDYLPQEDIPLFCYWIEKKLVRTPRFILSAHAFEEYVERHEFHVDSLIVLRQTLDPEAVSAMIHRAVERLVPRRIWVVSVLSTDNAQERLLDMLPIATASNVRFRRFQACEYGDEIFRKSANSTGDHCDEAGPSIQQIDRKFFMPKLIENRMRPRPEPGDDMAPNSVRQ